MTAAAARVIRAAAIGAALLGVLPACTQDARLADAAQEWRGAFGGGPSPATRVVRTQAEWSALWASLSTREPMSLPADSFGVQISLGLRNTGGYAVAVISAAPEGDQFVVVWSEARPAPGAIVIQALTDPYVVRVIPRTTLPVTFRQSP